MSSWNFWDSVSYMRGHIEEVAMPPFHMVGNLYFVGSVNASVHVIDTGDGLILLDSGYQDTLFYTLNGIYKLGLSPYDIKYILLTHGHIDHFGAARAIRDMTGCKIIISRLDLDYVTGARNLSYAEELGMPLEEIAFFDPDILIDDGDTITLGNTSIDCVLTPGHTEGTMSFFYTMKYDGRDLVVGTHGGVGTNSMESAFLKKHNLPFSLRDDFRKGLHALKQRHVDIFVGNHAAHNHTAEKYIQLINGDKDAFIDADEWVQYLDSSERNLDIMIAEEAKQDKKGALL